MIGHGRSRAYYIGKIQKGVLNSQISSAEFVTYDNDF